jgi:uroporphyrinogen decarboxylase
VLLTGSGTITLQSPAIARELSLPTIQKLTRMARQAGVPTMLHACGKERVLVRWCAEETDLDCINPLEVPPMGDCDLAEIKQAYGDRLALMGNLHTTDVMLFGGPKDVERAARAAIDAAGAGGGFILSTGDQCGRDTPDANIFKLVEVAKTYGRYAA